MYMKKLILSAIACAIALTFFACPTPTAVTTRTLTTAVSPADTGTVTRTPAGPTYADGSLVVLRAAAATGYVFDHWSGDATDNLSITAVAMTADMTVTAVFVPIPVNSQALTLAVSPVGSGTITPSPSGSSFTTGSTVTLTPTPATGYAFDYWTGDLTGSSNPGSVVMSAAKSITAVFRVLQPGGAVQGTPLSLLGAVTTISGARGVANNFDGTGVGALFNNLRQGVIVGAYLYFSDYGNNRIRRMNLATKAVTTFSGSGTAGHVDGSAGIAQFSGPDGMATDGSAYLYVSDVGSHTIRQVSLSDGSVVSIAGTANTTGSANNADGNLATFNGPYAVAYAPGSPATLYVADTENHLIRAISLTGTNPVTTLAGDGTGAGADGTGTGASFNRPHGIAWDGTRLWVVDYNGQIVREVTTGGVVTTRAGSYNVAATTDGTGSGARFASPRTVIYDGGVLYIAQHSDHTIRTMSTSGYAVSTLVGGGAGWADGVRATARFYTPTGFAISSGTLYVMEESNYDIRAVTVSSGYTTTVAGSHGLASYSDGTGVGAVFNAPAGMATDGTYLYFCEVGNAAIRKQHIATGVVTTVAGGAGAGSADGLGSSAHFNNPLGITTDGTWLYVCDYNNHTIRRIEIATSAVDTFAGLASNAGSHDDIGTAARFNAPYDITTDGTYLYVTEISNHDIRKIGISSRQVTTLSGQVGVAGYNNGTGTEARFNSPHGIITDGSKLYVCDYGNFLIRVVDPVSGTTTNLAGYAGVSGHAEGTGDNARFRTPNFITCDGTNLYVTDLDHTVRKIVIATKVVSTIAGSDSVNGYTDGTGTAARFYNPYGITTNGTYLYVSDNANHTIRKID
ncbi:MAG: hypothetical protein WCT14_11395 [Treponemataceae bacterium]